MLLFDKKMPIPAAPNHGPRPAVRRRVGARPSPSSRLPAATSPGETPQPHQEPLSLTMTVNPVALTDEQLRVEREAV